MSDIFIAYSHEDRERVRTLAEALAGQGWSVFWDRKIPTGLTWHSFVGKALEEARCVVVAWSHDAIQSEWVLEEAEDARKRNVLIPVLLDPVDPPLGFRSLQALDLTNWSSEADSSVFRQLVTDMERLLGPPPALKQATLDSEKPVDAEPSGETRVKMLKTAAGPRGAHQKNQIYTLPADLAHQYIEGGAAEPESGPVRTAKEDPQLEAARPRTEHERKQEATESPTSPVALRPRLALAVLFRTYRGVLVVMLAVVAGSYFVWFRNPAPDQPGDSLQGGGPDTAISEPLSAADDQPTVETTAVARAEGAPLPEEDELLNRRVLIRGGEFLMGSPEGVGAKSERPQHRVRISSFSMLQHEVTNAEYRRFMPERGFDSGLERYPVVNVTWNDARAYAGWLGGSLPTEAQWEFAARGTEGREYPWGDEAPTCARANFSGCGRQLKAVGGHPAGATPEGIEDLVGNVWEWCADWYRPYTEDHQTDPGDGDELSSLTGPSSGPFRVLRGGSFNDDPLNLRGALRNLNPPEDEFVDLGFRVVWSAAGGPD